MTKCPCCGANKTLIASSSARPGVYICSKCQSNEFDYTKNWVVDGEKAGKELIEYFKLSNAYANAQANPATTQQEFARIEEKYSKIVRGRTPKYVVFNPANSTPVAEFGDRNSALAHISGVLGDMIYQINPSCWRGRGDKILSIIES